MTTTATQPPEQGEIRFSASGRDYFSWCTAPGCGHCVRTPIGEPVRERCAAHVGIFDLVAISTSAPYQLQQILRYALKSPYAAMTPTVLA